MNIKLKENEAFTVTDGSGVVTDVLSIRGKQDALTAGDGIAIDGNDTVRTTGIPFGRCDSTSTSTEFTATVPGIDRLEDGVCCIIGNGVVTSTTGFTLNVNGLGAKPVYTNLAAATRDTTIFNVNYTMLFVYDEARVEGGCWICYRGGGSSVQSDWNQTDSTANDYIKNKPEMLSATYDVARTALVIDIPSVTEQLIEQQLYNL